MRRFFAQNHQVRLKTALAVVGVVAFLTAALTRWIPDALWRYRLERLIATKIEGEAPGNYAVWSNPSFQLYHGLSADELADARRDPGRVIDRLLDSIARPGVESRRKKALRALDIYVDELEGSEQPRRFIARGVALLASGTLPIDLETDLASNIASRAHSFGIEETDRKAFRERARVILRSSLPHPDYAKVWAWSLAQLGGAEEKEIILSAWDRLDQNGQAKMREFEIVGPEDRSD